MFKSQAVVFLVAISLAGCQPSSGIRNIFSGYMTGTPEYQSDDGTFSIISGLFPRKTYLTLLSLDGKRLRDSYYPHFVMTGPRKILPQADRAIVSAAHLSHARESLHLLCVSFRQSRVIKDVALPRDCNVLSIHQPAGFSDVMALLLQHGRLLLQRIDPNTGELLTTETIGEFHENYDLYYEAIPSVVLWADSAHVLILEAHEGRQTWLLTYDWRSKTPTVRLPLAGDAVDLRESETPGLIYGLCRKPGINRAVLFAASFPDKSFTSLIEVEGDMESFIEVNGTFFIIGRDMDRPADPKRSWLHPRLLAVVDGKSKTMMARIEWTRRMGKFIGITKDKRELYYAVLDRDNPGIWKIPNDPKSFAAVRNDIR